MRKTILLAILLLFCVSNANAALAPLNVQQAKITTDTNDNDQLTIGFDWFRNHTNIPGSLADARSTGMNLPRIDWRHSFNTSIPTRIGLSTSLNYGSAEAESAGVEFGDTGAFGFGNLGLTLEAGLVHSDNTNITFYINQSFPLIHNDLLIANTLRPVNGRNAYGFQTGAEYQFNLGKNLTWYGDLGYRFDVPDAGETQNSLVYYNEAVWGADDWGLSLGLLGTSVYNDDIGTDLRLVPGLVLPAGSNSQFRVGVPIGLNPASPDFGVQASLFTTF